MCSMHKAERWAVKWAAEYRPQRGRRIEWTGHTYTFQIRIFQFQVNLKGNLALF